MTSEETYSEGNSNFGKYAIIGLNIGIVLAGGFYLYKRDENLQKQIDELKNSIENMKKIYDKTNVECQEFKEKYHESQKSNKDVLLQLQKLEIMFRDMKDDNKNMRQDIDWLADNYNINTNDNVNRHITIDNINSRNNTNNTNNTNNIRNNMSNIRNIRNNRNSNNRNNRNSYNRNNDQEYDYDNRYENEYGYKYDNKYKNDYDYNNRER